MYIYIKNGKDCVYGEWYMALPPQSYNIGHVWNSRKYTLYHVFTIWYQETGGNTPMSV